MVSEIDRANPQTDVLLVEDTASLALAYANHLQNDGLSVATASLGEKARNLLLRNTYAVVLLDLQLPDLDGFELLREIKKRDDESLVIVVTADASHDRVVAAMRMDAHDYLVKPITPERLLVTVRNALKLVALREQISSFGLPQRDRFKGFVGACNAMQAVYNAIENVAESKATVFITGESGTGKEVCADAIHRSGPRRDMPFVAINCGAIPSELIESEIFGHVKGAFTGAVSNRDGAATMAHGGTLFLDEICEMDVNLQTKLLRFLQTNQIQRVGSEKTEKVDVRVICATNRDPLVAVAEGRFREDLYYRLNVIPLHLPPLRERADDVLLIASNFLEEFSAEENKSFTTLSSKVSNALQHYRWPGNVRELQNVIRRVVVMNEGEQVALDMLPDAITGKHTDSLPLAPATVNQSTALTEYDSEQSGYWVPTGLSLQEIERTVIETTINDCDGNIPRAARLLGVSPSTLYRKRQAWAKNSNRG
jgi:two-component system repressor protein LuxO